MTKAKATKEGFTGSGLTPEEVSLGRIRYSEYLKNYPQLNKLSNKQLLEELVWLECLQERFKKNVGIVSQPTTGPDGKMSIAAIPRHLNESITEGLNQIMALKTKLGLFEDQKQLDAFRDIDDLKHKAAEYRKQNPLSFKCTCFPAGTKISLPNRDVKNIEDIQIGDEILGIEHCGKKGNKFRTQKVLDVILRGKKQVLKLTTEQGRELQCTFDHRIFASTTADSTCFKYLPAVNCLNKKIKTVFQINYNIYLQGVLLGLIGSDGHQHEPSDKKNPNWNFETQFFIYQSPKCETQTIEEVLLALNIEYTKSNLVNKETEFGDGIYTYRIKTKHSKLIKSLQSELYQSHDLQIGYLAGFILGDGTINQLGNSFIIQKKEKYRNILKQIFLNLGIASTETLRKDGCYFYNLGKQIPLLFPNSNKAIKQNIKYGNQGFNLPNDRIIKIEVLQNEVDVFDITTETQNFIANEILVHNCPYCSKIFFLKRRTTNYEEFKSPFYAEDKILKNDELHAMWKEGLISAERYGKVLGVSSDYPAWLDEHVYMNGKTKEN